MAVKMRLRREGKKKQPFYRVVVADSRSPRDGRYIEDIGYYQPTHEPSTISIDGDRALYWLRNGAQPSEPVLKLLRIQGIWEEFKPGDTGRDRSEANARKAAQRAAKEEAARKAEQEAATARAEKQAAAQSDAPEVEQAVEQAVEEATQPDAGAPEETGALE
ncbi:MAG TPA: 30S ribosomal protein S16, partial [Egibacteraceae bacterium]|nr:30S ribosomal protein S16 [Egibacteraceae bacterium]